MRYLICCDWYLIFSDWRINAATHACASPKDLILLRWISDVRQLYNGCNAADIPCRSEESAVCENTKPLGNFNRKRVSWFKIPSSRKVTLRGDPVRRKSKLKKTKIGNINTSFCFDESHYDESKISLYCGT